MARPRENLARAPIVEALVDIRTSIPASGSASERFAAARSALAESYPQQGPMQSVEARFGPEEPFTQKTKDLGVIFRSKDGKNVAQFRLNGFTFSRLDPYSDWPSVFGEAQRLVRLYSQLVPDVLAGRLAVRYINRLKLPLGAPLGKYLTAPPSLPEGVPQSVLEYVSRIVVQEPEHKLAAVITQALEPTIEQTVTSILLDVDAFRDLPRPLLLTDPGLELIFNRLRDLKNRIFFASITDMTAEMYE